MRDNILYLIIITIGLSLASCSGGGIGKTRPATALDSVSYAIGVNQGTAWKGGMKRSKVELNLDMIVAGMRDAMSADSTAPIIKPENAGHVIESYFELREKNHNKENLEKGRKFLAENAKKSGIKITKSGLQYEVENEGDGQRPLAHDTVMVYYRGMLVDGTVFETNYNNPEPTKIYLSRVIKGWTEGIQLMREGAKYKFFIPTELAYGEYVYPNSPFEANVPLIFEVELIKVIPGEKPDKNL